MTSFIFISYWKKDISWAKWVKERLEAAGFSCWMAPESIPGGANYAKELSKAIEGCDAFVVILSGGAQESIWVPKEIDQAINAKKLVLPFCIENTPLIQDIGFYLSNVQRYDAWKDPEGEIRSMIRDLCAAVKRMSEEDRHRSYGSRGIRGVLMISGDGLKPKPSGSIQDERAKARGNDKGGRKKKGSAGLLIAALSVFVIIFFTALSIIWWNRRSGSDGQNVGPGGSTVAAGESTDDFALTADAETAANDEGSAPDMNGYFSGETEQISSGQDEGEQGEDEPDEDVQEESKPQIHYNTNGKVRILNKKYAQAMDFERLAARFQDESGIEVTVETPGETAYSEALEREITGRASDPTLFMLTGLRDFEEYGAECLELSGSAVYGELWDDSYTLRGSNGKVYGLACIVEAYGLCVNTRLLEKAGYTVSDIRSFENLKRVAEDITSRKNTLGFSAFTSPSVGVGVSGDYRFAKHAPAVPLYYELKDNDFNIGLKLQGTYIDCFRDYIDLYLDNATVPRNEASTRSLIDAQKEFLTEKAVFHQDGSWDYEELKAVMDDQAAVIPLYMGMPGEEAQGVNKTSTCYWCVNQHASQDDREAALQFLYWVVTSEEGIRIMTQDMGFQIPYRKSDIPDNIFLKTLHEEEESGYKPISQYYKYGENLSWSNSMMNTLEAYANGTGDWAAVKKAFTALW